MGGLLGREGGAKGMLPPSQIIEGVPPPPPPCPHSSYYVYGNKSQQLLDNFRRKVFNFIKLNIKNSVAVTLQTMRHIVFPSLFPFIFLQIKKHFIGSENGPVTTL